MQCPAVTAEVDAFLADCNLNSCTCIVGECDFVVLVRGKGVVLMKVKSSVKKRAEAVSQLDRMHKLVNI